MELNKLKKDIAISTFFVLFSIFLWTIAIPIGIPMRASWGGDYGLNSRTFPYFATVIIGLCAFILIIKSLVLLLILKKKMVHESLIPTKSNINVAGEIRAFVIMLLFIAYAFIFVFQGFILATLIICPIALFYLGERSFKRWYLYLSVFVFSTVMYLLFTKILKVHLP